MEKMKINDNKIKMININVENFNKLNKGTEKIVHINKNTIGNFDETKNANLTIMPNLGLPKENMNNLEEKNFQVVQNESREENSKFNESNENLFQSLGIYYIENASRTRKNYYNILHRKMIIQENNKIDNFFFQDVTDLVNFHLRQFEETVKKQRIFAKISHEFKTPLNSIMAVINIIRDSEKFLSENLNKNLEMISNLSNYIIYLISDIIQYVSIQDINDLKVNISTLNVKEIINFCFQTLNSLLACNKVKSEKITSYLTYDEAIENFKAESDENRIKQIILNFVSNSVKFTREGSIKLKCKTIKIDNKFFIKMSVKDTGIGIKEADKNKLFKDFGLIENQAKTINNVFGTGLGLSICKSIVEKLELKLEFKSHFMKGSKFSILIPCIENENFETIANRSDIILINEKSCNKNDDMYYKIKNSHSYGFMNDGNNVDIQDISKNKYLNDSHELVNKKSIVDLNLSYDHKNKMVINYSIYKYYFY